MGTGHATLSFLSDFGAEDEAVGVVKSVVRAIAPDAVVIDLVHGIPPHDVRAGALALARAMPYVAPGVILAIVDPGGPDRQAVAVEVGDGAGVLVGPDNGLLAPAVALAGGASRAVALTSSDYHLDMPSATFTGRDVLAPVAAHLCSGVSLDQLGPALDPALLVPGVIPLSRREGDRIEAEVLFVDRFGNVQINVDPDELVGFGDQIVVGAGTASRRVGLATTYSAIAPGRLALVVDAHGLLSICSDRAAAAEELSLDVGDAVSLAPAPVEDNDAGSPVSLGSKRR